MHGAESEPVFGSPSAKCFDIGHIENQLGDGLATFAPAVQEMKHDVVARDSEIFQLDNEITFFSVN